MTEAERPIPSDRRHPLVVGLGEVLWDLLPQGRRLGGAPANFVYHATALGARGVLISRVGNDALGKEILSELDRIGIDRRYVSSDPDHATGTVIVRLRKDGQPEFNISEDVAWDYIGFSTDLANLASRADAICFGTLSQRSPASRQTIRQILNVAGPDCLRVFDVNIRQHYWDLDTIEDLLRQSDLLKLNEDELAILQSRMSLKPDQEDALREIRTKYGLRLVALTRGADGSVLLGDDEVSRHPGMPVKVLDAVGAGDAFTAALVMGMMMGMDLDAINHNANLIASYVCSNLGGTPDIPEDIKRQLKVGAD